MPDVFTKAQRSAVMARIRSKGNRDTELRLIALIRAAGIGGWRRGITIRIKVAARRLITPGPVEHLAPRLPRKKSPPSSARIRPDFVFPRQRVVVFVDGCFFHGCPQHATWPKSNASFWRAKIEGNRARDRQQTRLLRAHGWQVLRIWQHALTPPQATRTIGRLRRMLASTIA